MFYKKNRLVKLRAYVFYCSHKGYTGLMGNM